MPGLYRTANEKKALEARNGVIQARAVVYHAENWQADSKLTPEIVKEFHRLAINQIYSCAGQFRDGPVQIAGVKHQPPSGDLVEDLVSEMCGYVDANWIKPPVHLSAYLMWRINWIHPFFGGNGRTSRAVSYLVLCARLGFRIPGERTIPDLIEAERDPYYKALREADEAWLAGSLNVLAMEALLSSMLARQLVSVHKAALGQ